MELLPAEVRASLPALYSQEHNPDPRVHLNLSLITVSRIRELFGFSMRSLLVSVGDYLRFYSHPYVYSCALPPVMVASILKALELGTTRPELRQRLWENAEYFHSQLDSLGIDTGDSTTYIMPIVIGDRERLYDIGHELRQRGLWVAPVDYPAVPQEKICFRACVTANHTRADLDEALNILSDTLLPARIPQLQHAH